MQEIRFIALLFFKTHVMNTPHIHSMQDLIFELISHELYSLVMALPYYPNVV
ncbi:Uncharacterised protein [Citrobacter werkmanii]|uniref:Uncharacterized protein n=1 Tax=Citrobacter werkmanii TaxID=67827 RepID=A0ABN7GZV7_9ENTR|nr:Uncharacterised protein [Citrobacter werkmanii]